MRKLLGSIDLTLLEGLPRRQAAGSPLVGQLADLLRPLLDFFEEVTS